MLTQHPRPLNRLRARLQAVWANHWCHAEPLGHHLYRVPLLWLALAALAGVGLGMQGDRLGWNVLAILLPLGILSAVASLFLARRSAVAAIIIGWLSAVTLFWAYTVFSQPPCIDSLGAAATRASQPVAMQVIIESTAEWIPNPFFRPGDPEEQRWRTRWDVTCVQVRDGKRWLPVEAHSVLTVDGREETILPGDLVRVFGSFRAVHPPTNPGGFDFATYSAQFGQFVTLHADRPTQLSIIDANHVFRIARLRGHCVRVVDRWLRQYVVFDQAPLAAALIFGAREQVDWDQQQELMATGTLHVLAISGMHIEIVAGVILFLCAVTSLSNRTTFLLILISCGSYAFLAGGRPPVLRAVILACAFALARCTGRQMRLINVLSLAALVLLLIHTRNAQNVGVHLSFLAVLSIGTFAVGFTATGQRRAALQSLVESSYGPWRYRWLLFRRRLGELLQISGWVWLVTAPIIWHNFHVVAPIAVILNVLIAIPLTISLLFGLLTAVLGWLPLAGSVCGFACGGCLWGIQALIGLGDEIPLGHLWLPAPSLSWTILYYAVIILWLAVVGRNYLGGLAGSLSLLLFAAVLPACFGQRGYLHPLKASSTASKGPVIQQLQSSLVQSSVLASKQELAGDSSQNRREFRCTFLDVGHGTSVILEMPTGEVWLYDAGRMGNSQSGYRAIAEALWEMGTARIHRLIISHADADHYNAVDGLLERFAVERITSTSFFYDSDAPDVRSLIDTIEDYRIPCERWSAPRSILAGEVCVRILHPNASWQVRSDNANSLCLLLEYAGKRILLPGDLEGAGLTELSSLPARPCHVLMAPHHGSVAFDPQELLQWCRPEAVVISGNHRALQGRVLQRYDSPEYRLGITFRDGAIQARISAEGELSIYRWSQDDWIPLPGAKGVD